MISLKKVNFLKCQHFQKIWKLTFKSVNDLNKFKG
jgi:hypothetical protein